MKIQSPLDIIKNLRRTYKKKKRRTYIERRFGLDKQDRFYYPDNTVHSMANRRYSIIVPIYRVEKYLNQMLSSLLRQNLDFNRHLEVILVNDGSDDKSGDICQQWANKFPDNFIYLHKKNGGLSSARNYGLPYATGDWITFTDPDDLLDNNYFLKIDQALDAVNEDEIIHLIAPRLILFHESNYTISSNHPLNYRMRFGTRVSQLNSTSDDIHLSGAAALFNRQLLINSKLQFDESIKPNAEDAHLVSRFFLYYNPPKLLFVPQAEYIYRKRSDKSSLLDTSWNHEGVYIDILERFCIYLLSNFPHSNVKSAPRWLQRTILYHICWHIKRFLNNHRHVSQIPISVRARYIVLLKKIFSLISPEIILNFELGSLTDAHRFTMMALGHSEISNISNVSIFRWDKRTNQFCCHFYFTGPQPSLIIKIGGREISSIASKIRNHTFLEEPFVREYFGWYPWQDNGMIEFWIDGKFINQPIGMRTKYVTVNRLIPSGWKNSRRMPIAARTYRWLSQTSLYRRKYRDAWMLIDRDTQADDNAEHLYHYIKTQHPEKNIWFVIRKNANDWERLRRQGFKLIEFNSLNHKMIYLNAKHIVSSHAAGYIRNYLPQRWYRDLTQWDFTFLQHGVIHTDVSENLPAHAFNNFIVSSKMEYDSICGNGTGYTYTSKEVALTGLPRHDRLLIESRKRKPKNIVIMPTWRSSLSMPMSPRTNEREKFRYFLDSAFFKTWKSLLSSEGLKSIAKKHRLNIVFFPHAELKYYLNDFQTEGVRLARNDGKISIQDELLDSAVMITDYSSVAFDQAYMGRPVIYYQFDEMEFFTTGHAYKKGYFDYRRDGFGPVCTNESELLSTLEATLNSKLEHLDDYASRMEGFFKYRDGRCAERVFNLIDNAERSA